MMSYDHVISRDITIRSPSKLLAKRPQVCRMSPFFQLYARETCGASTSTVGVIFGVMPTACFIGPAGLRDPNSGDVRNGGGLSLTQRVPCSWRRAREKTWLRPEMKGKHWVYPLKNEINDSWKSCWDIHSLCIQTLSEKALNPLNHTPSTS